MNEKINLKEIERKAYTSYHQDGLIEISIAFTILAFSLMIISDLPWLGGVIGITAISFYAGAKKALTVPRIGYVKFPQQRAQRITTVTVALGVLAFVAGMVALLQTMNQGTPDWLVLLIENYMLTIGTTVAALFLLAGYAFKTKRIYTYALLTLIMFVAGHFIYFPLYYYLTALGILILMCGLFLMIRFVRKYPKATETADA
jgi:hypothetical protein